MESSPKIRTTSWARTHAQKFRQKGHTAAVKLAHDTDMQKSAADSTSRILDECSNGLADHEVIHRTCDMPSVIDWFC